jgi:hypothetical protein
MNFESVEPILKILDILFSGVVIAIISIWIHKSEKKDNSTLKTMSGLTDLFSKYKKTMRNINTALAESEELYKKLSVCLENEDFSGFNKLYYTDEYKKFREAGYFFEMLGTMVKRNEIDPVSVIHCFSFPIEFFRKTKKIRDIIREKNCLPDYWANFRYLCAYYNGAKISTARGWIVNGEIILLSDKELEELPVIDEKYFRYWRRLAKKKKATRKKIDKSDTW